MFLSMLGTSCCQVDILLIPTPFLSRLSSPTFQYLDRVQVHVYPRLSFVCLLGLMLVYGFLAVLCTGLACCLLHVL